MVLVKKQLDDPYRKTPENIFPPYGPEHVRKGITEEEYLKTKERIINFLENGWTVELTLDGMSWHAIWKNNDS